MQPDYQKKLFKSAFALLRPGGTLVYSTCTVSREICLNKVVTTLLNDVPYLLYMCLCVSMCLCASYACVCVYLCYHAQINPSENEHVVAWALREFSDYLILVESEIKIGEPGLRNAGLNEEERHRVQRFEPGIAAGEETIGFFVAKFKKRTEEINASAFK